jgi:hypothetical protein
MNHLNYNEKDYISMYFSMYTIPIQMAARYSRYGRASKRVKVAHRMTPYDYAVRSVIFRNGEQPRLAENECRNILEGEALMENTQDTSQYMASQRHVHSEQRAVAGNDGLGLKLKNLRFAGFAVTGFDQKYGVYEQGFMATIGGVNTVINTGDRFLEAGLPLLVIPTQINNAANNLRNAIGVHRDKKLFATVHPKYEEQERGVIGGSFYNQAVAALQVDDVNHPTIQNPIAAQRYLKKFEVGTVIRGGRSGQPIDVVLHANANIIENDRRNVAAPQEA